MTKLLRQAIDRLESLPSDRQDEIAESVLRKIDEDDWSRRFATTTESQWKALADRAREQVARGVEPLDDL